MILTTGLYDTNIIFYGIMCVMCFGIFSLNAVARCRNGDLWLVDGTSDREGRLEMCYNYQWGTVCDDYWTQSSTNVACRELGFYDGANGSYI